MSNNERAAFQSEVIQVVDWWKVRSFPLLKQDRLVGGAEFSF
jgi:hypothetical protein